LNFVVFSKLLPFAAVEVILSISSIKMILQNFLELDIKLKTEKKETESESEKQERERERERRRKREREREREREKEIRGKSRRTRERLKETRGNSDLLHNNPLSQLVTLGSCVGPTVEGAA